MSQQIIRRASREDDGRIRALLRASFDDNAKGDPAFTRWQYWHNPFGPTRSWVAELGGEVVSHWAAITVPLRLDGQLVSGAKGVDIATHPAHRGKGLYRSVAEALVADCAAGGVAVLLSHPNPESAAGLASAGGVLAAQATAMVRPLDAGWLAGRFHLPRPLAQGLVRAGFRIGRGDEHRRVDVLPDAEIDGLWDAATTSVSSGIVRDAAWWRWRYASRPVRPYTFVETRADGRLTGLAALHVAERFGGRFGLVLELLARDDAAARGLAGGLTVAAAAHGAVGLALATTPGSTLAAQARRAGFRRLPRRLEPRPLRMVVTAPGGDSAALAGRPWSMAWGDLDHL